MRFVLATFGSHGDVNPYLTLARALRARGHEVALATHAHYRPLVEGAGFALHAVRPDYEEAWGPAVMHPRRGGEVLVRRCSCRRLRESYDDLCAALRAPTRSSRIRSPSPRRSPRPPPAWPGRAACSPRSASSRSPARRRDAAPRPELAALRRAWPAGYRAFLRAGRRVTRPWTRPVAALRAELGLAPGAHPVFEGQHAPALVLALFSPLLATPQPDWPAQTLVTGALADDAVHAAAFGPADAAGGDGALPAALTRFLDDGPAPIVVTLGTSAVLAGDAPRIYREALAAAGRVGARVVLLTGRDARNVPPGPLPAWACAVPAASHAALFPRAAAVVHQGGMGTLDAGAPQWPPDARRPLRARPARQRRSGRATGRRARLSARALPRRARGRHARRPAGRCAGDARAAAVGTQVRTEDGASTAAEALIALAGS
jgi:hypothetical protein